MFPTIRNATRKGENSRHWKDRRANNTAFHKHSLSLSHPSYVNQPCYLPGLTPVPACFPVRGRRCVNHPALLTEGPRYFDVLITLCRTSMSLLSFSLSHCPVSGSQSFLPLPPPPPTKTLLIKAPRNRLHDSDSVISTDKYSFLLVYSNKLSSCV